MKALAAALALPFLIASAASAAEPALSATTEASLAMRARNDVPAPKGEATIYLRFYAYHHGSSDFSYIAWRAADGTWTVSSVGETNSDVPAPPGMDTTSWKPVEKTRALATKDAAALDALLKSTSLASGPVPARDTGVGAPQITMEIVAPTKHVVVSWMGEPSGDARHIADIVLGFAR